MAKILNLNGAAVTQADDKYPALEDVLLSGKTLADLTSPQIIFLRSQYGPQHPEYLWITNEFAKRLIKGTDEKETDETRQADG
jgi:hypothetical protein